MNEIPSSVHCSITGCDFKIVSNDTGDDSFSDYCTKTLDKLKQNEIIYFIIHCYFIKYNQNSNSVFLLEFAECFDDDFFKDDIKENASVNIRNGWILVSPLHKNYLTQLNSIFTHQNISIICFNINNDISLLMNEGFQFNFNNIIEPQIIDDQNSKIHFIHQIKLEDNCAEAGIIKKEKPNILKLATLEPIFFNEDNIFQQFNEIDFWQMAIVELVKIAIFLLNSVKTSGLNKVKELSSAKISSFSDIQKQYGILAPYLLNKFSTASFINKVKLSDAQIINNYNMSKLIIDNYELYSTLAPERKILPKDNVQAILDHSSNLLKAKMKNNYNIEDIDAYIQNSKNTNLIQNWNLLKPKLNNENIKKIKSEYNLISQAFTKFNSYINLEIEERAMIKSLVEYNFSLVISAINTYISFENNDDLKEDSKKIGKLLFNSVFNTETDSNYITDIFPIYNIHDQIIYNKETSAYINFLELNENALILSFFYTIISIQENLERPFTFILTKSSLTTSSNKKILDNSIKALFTEDLIFDEYVKYIKTGKCKKPCICFIHIDSILPLLQKLKNENIDIFKITRFCMTNVNHRNIYIDVFYSVLSSKIDEMIKNKSNFPLQALLISDAPEISVQNCFDNISKLVLPKRSMFLNQNTFHIKVNKKTVDTKSEIQNQVKESATELIKEMANNNPEDIGNILIFSTGNSRINDIENYLIGKSASCSSENCNVIVIKNCHTLLNTKGLENFYSNLDKEIENEMKELKQEKKKNTLIILPITMIGIINKDKRKIINQPIQNHPNIIKVVITPNNLPNEILIPKLYAVVDCGLFVSNYRNSNDIICKSEEVISIKNQNKRKKNLGQNRPGVFVTIVIKDNEPKDELET